jgi:hypothetical protein
MITFVVSRLLHAAQREIAHARALLAHASPTTPPGYDASAASRPSMGYGDASASCASEHARISWILYVR